MMADADLQVWLDTQPGTNQVVMIPYVKSVRNMQMHYRLEVVQRSGGSTSRISQQGQVNAVAAQPMKLAHVAIGMQAGGECRVEVALSNGNRDMGTYRFDCAR
jgi:hypothetical protein